MQGQQAGRTGRTGADAAPCWGGMRHALGQGGGGPAPGSALILRSRQQVARLPFSPRAWALPLELLGMASSCYVGTFSPWGLSASLVPTASLTAAPTSFQQSRCPSCLPGGKRAPCQSHIHATAGHRPVPPGSCEHTQQHGICPSRARVQKGLVNPGLGPTQEKSGASEPPAALPPVATSSLQL